MKKRVKKKLTNPTNNAAPVDAPPAPQIGNRALTARLLISPVEAEKRLLEAFTRLRGVNQYPKISSRKLGEFWSEDWIRSPFEEDLTFSQLLSLPPRVMIGKHSFNQRKLECLLGVIEKALASYADDSTTVSPPIIPNSQLAVESTSGTSFINTIFRSSLNALSNSGCLKGNLWEALVNTLLQAADKQEFDHLIINPSPELCSALLSGHIRESAPDAATLLDLSLAAPAINPKALIPTSIRDGIWEDLLLVVIKLAILSFEGREVIIEGKRFGIFSRDPEFLIHVITPYRGKISEDSIKHLSRLMGTLTRSQIEELISN